jgi:hypothetical protein
MNTQEPTAGYASWISPDGSPEITYSLGLFHEIDTLVNDGYRRIPHGGVETAGLLFGAWNDQGLRIEALRLIQCQHAFGPSFLLSEGDLQKLREQLSSYQSDEDLQGLRPVGWFIGHTRSPLEMNDREAAWFEEFFPGEGSVTVLVKPERFQPTRFGFLMRDENGRIGRDATRAAVILPLSAQLAVPPRRSSSPTSAPNRMEPRVVPEEAEVEIPESAAELPFSSLPEPQFPSAPEPSLSSFPTGSQLSSSGRVTRVREVRTPRPPVMQEAPVVRSSEPHFPYAAIPQNQRRPERRKDATFGWKSVAILVLAAFLGCLVGYWAYLQLPSPVIPVSVREQQHGQLVVEWPSAQTQDVDYAALQINDGQWVSLSSVEKTTGRAVVTVPNGDVKIDLLAKRWLRDSRGIVRYIRTPRSVPQTAPATGQR